ACLNSLSTFCDTCLLALHHGAKAPVLSVAISILIGAAANALCDLNSQLPAPAIQPEVASADSPLSIRRRSRPPASAVPLCFGISLPPPADQALPAHLDDQKGN